MKETKLTCKSLLLKKFYFWGFKVEKFLAQILMSKFQTHIHVDPRMSSHFLGVLDLLLSIQIHIVQFTMASNPRVISYKIKTNTTLFDKNEFIEINNLHHLYAGYLMFNIDSISKLIAIM